MENPFALLKGLREFLAGPLDAPEEPPARSNSPLHHVTLELRSALSGDSICNAELRQSDTVDKLRRMAARELKQPISYIQLLNGHRVLSTSETLYEAGLGNGSIVNVLKRPCFLVTGSADRTAKLWDTVSGECFRTFAGHTGRVNSATPSPDNRHILTSSDDGTAKLWCTESGECILTVESGHGPILSATIAPDGQHIAAGTCDGVVQMWAIPGGERKMTINESESMTVRKVDFSPDGRSILTASGDCGTARVWDAETGKNLMSLRGLEDIVFSARYSPDGQLVLTGCGDDAVQVWHADSGELALQLEGHDGAVYSAEWQSNGRRILTGSSDCTAKMWNAKSGQCIRTIEGHGGEVSSVNFSPDGSLFATGSMDNTARLWATRGGMCKVIMEGHTGAVLSVDFARA
mmetsp:Transcript_56266/g.99812  ORF Transcript_56266/g.99812 Transcript_56266/m.99812 type:complete len:406 (+) Transcript_56266:44-1261(+)